MSGTIKIQDDALLWLQGWAFDGLLTRLIKQLEPVDPQLVLRLTDAFRFTGTGYCQLQDLSAERLRTVLGAMEVIYKHEVQAGPNSFNQPDFYPYFMCVSSLFKAMLRFDPRSGESLDSIGSIAISETAIWTATGWICDLVLEHLAAEMYMFDPATAMTLLAGRQEGSTIVTDLRELGGQHIKLLNQTVDWIYIHYGDGGGYDSYWPEFYAKLGPPVVLLKKLFDMDVRSTGSS